MYLLYAIYTLVGISLFVELQLLLLFFSCAVRRVRDQWRVVPAMAIPRLTDESLASFKSPPGMQI